MKLLSIASSVLFSTAVLADGSFLLSDKGASALGALQAYAEIQSQGYSATNPDDYAVPSELLAYPPTADQISLTHVIDNASPLSISAGFYLNNAAKELIISFTSAAGLSDYLSDEAKQLIPYTFIASGNITENIDALVHSGAFAAFQTIWKEIEQVVADISGKIPGLNLTVLGHSIGGPIAGLSGLELARSGYNTKVITYGSPRFGDSALSQLIDNVFNHNDAFEKLSQGIISGFIRHTHDFDIVTALPIDNYAPNGLKIFLNNEQFPVRTNNVAVCAPGALTCDGLEKLNPPDLSIGNIFGALTSLYNSHASYYTFQVPGNSRMLDTVDRFKKADDAATNLPFSFPTGSLPFPFPTGGLPFSAPTGGLPFPFPTGLGQPFPIPLPNFSPVGALPSDPIITCPGGFKLPPPSDHLISVISRFIALFFFLGIDFFLNIIPFFPACFTQDSVKCFSFLYKRVDEILTIVRIVIFGNSGL